MTTKYDRAVNHARNGGAHPNAPEQQSGEMTTPPPAVRPAMVQRHNDVARAFGDHVQQKGWETAPQLYTMEPGDMITGILEGHGIPAEIEKVGGVIESVDTWIIESGGARLSILSSVQLDRKLPGFVGGEVTIARLRDDNIGGGKRVTQYAVGGPRLANGQLRDWSGNNSKLLPSGNAS